MFTITDGLILKGENLQPSYENILIDDGIILEINKDVAEGEIIDAKGCIVCPSFLNGHTHIGDSIIPDEGYGLGLDEIVKPPNGLKHILLSKSSDKDLIENMKESLWEMFNSGTTHFIDYREGSIKGIKILKKAAKNIPINPIILGRDESFYRDDPDLKEVKIAIRKLLKYCDGIAPSGLAEIKNEVADLITRQCRRFNKISSIHTAESLSCQINSLEKYGKTEIARAIGYGFDQIVHATNCKNNDLKLISNSNVNLVLCPRSNATLSVGWPQIDKIIKYGIKPILGTDNIMLNSPFMSRELEFVVKNYSLMYSRCISSRELVKMSTTNIIYNDINQMIGKCVIGEGDFSQLMIVRQRSRDPYLSIINRLQTKDIKNIINRNSIHKF